MTAEQLALSSEQFIWDEDAKQCLSFNSLSKVSFVCDIMARLTMDSGVNSESVSKASILLTDVGRSAHFDSTLSKPS